MGVAKIFPGKENYYLSIVYQDVTQSVLNVFIAHHQAFCQGSNQIGIIKRLEKNGGP